LVNGSSPLLGGGSPCAALSCHHRPTSVQALGRAHVVGVADATGRVLDALIGECARVAVDQRGRVPMPGAYPRPAAADRL